MGRIRTSYEVITEESAAEGDAAERGWVDEDGEVLGVNAAIEWLRSKGPLEPSSSGFHKGIWYSGPSEQDMYTGDYRQEAYHLAGFTEDQQRRVYEGVVAPRRRRNPHEQYYGDEESPEDAERMRRLKAISDAALARKNPAKKRPTGQCVSCGAVCAVYGDPPICHPCDVVMAQEEHAEREGIPGRPGYKKSPGRKNPSAGRFTAFEAAKEFAKYLKRAGYKDAAAWDREMVQRTGWDPTADAQVALEGGPDLSCSCTARDRSKPECSRGRASTARRSTAG